MKGKRSGWVMPLLVVVSVFVGASFVGYLGGPVPLFEKFGARLDDRQQFGGSGKFGYPNGREVMLIYIGAKGCSWSASQDNIRAVRTLVERLKKREEKSQLAIRTIGVAADWSIDAGIHHLRRIGGFTELAVGGNWLNQTLVKYVWRDRMSRPVTPQVLFVERTVTTPGSARGIGFQVGEEHLLKRLLGKREIVEWSKREDLLPPHATSVPTRGGDSVD